MHEDAACERHLKVGHQHPEVACPGGEPCQRQPSCKHPDRVHGKAEGGGTDRETVGYQVRLEVVARDPFEAALEKEDEGEEQKDRLPHEPEGVEVGYVFLLLRLGEISEDEEYDECQGDRGSGGERNLVVLDEGAGNGPEEGSYAVECAKEAQPGAACRVVADVRDKGVGEAVEDAAPESQEQHAGDQQGHGSEAGESEQPCERGNGRPDGHPFVAGLVHHGPEQQRPREKSYGQVLRE